MKYFFLVLLFALEVSSDPKAVAKTGTYIGSFRKTTSNSTYHSFRGIKYASQSRFKAATPVKESSKVFQAKEWPSPCIQTDGSRIKGKEDCLYLNVHTCDVNTSLPVIVFIHGGRFTAGNGSYDPDYWMTSCNIVYASIQYRLGIFGFSDFKSKKYPANIGLRDQIQALKWIQENIKYFGGDPKKVTIQGQSAGSVSVNLLLQSPLARGLFRGGISQSGVGCSSWGVISQERARKVLKLLAERNRCIFKLIFLKDNQNADKIANCFLKQSAKGLIDVSNSISVLPSVAAAVHGPVVENEKDPNAVIPYYPWAKKNAIQVPWISGVTSLESRLLEDFELPQLLKLFVTVTSFKVLPDLGLYKETASNPNKVTQEIMNYYGAPSIFSTENFIKFFMRSSTDLFQNYPNFQCHNLIRNVPTYNYNFGRPLPGKNDSAHTEDLPFFFNGYKQLNVQRDLPDVDKNVSRTMIDLWISFATNLIPEANGVKWRPWDPQRKEVLNINVDGDFQMTLDPHLKGIMFNEKLPLRDKIKKKLNIVT